MRNLFQRLRGLIAGGEDAVLVTIVASSGSTPRGSGARMLISASGHECGTVGGGAVEYRSEQMAAEILKTRQADHLEQFRLHPNDVADIGMICGGAVDVFFRFCAARDAQLLDLTDRIEACFARGEHFWLICNVTGGQTGAMSVYSEQSGLFGAALPEAVIAQLSGKPGTVEAGGESFYCEELQKPGKVYIFGGGHVAQALVPALAAVNFRCIVLEDRPEFARPELFPGVEETRLVDMNDLSLLQKEITANDCVCIMTRGHQNDIVVQSAMMKTPARYIGVIGSAKKQTAVREKLSAMGFTEKDFCNVFAPIGLNIGAETPAEIAVSIAGQLIMVRAGRDPADWAGERRALG